MNEVTEIVTDTFAEETSIFIKWFESLCTWENLFKLIFAVIFILILTIIKKILLKSIKKIPQEKSNPHKKMLATRFVTYLFYFIVIMYVLSLFGIKLTTIWGAAGIAGIAIGFAAQTSFSNLISGLFVLTEGTIKKGDFISVGDVSGTIDTVNLLSIYINTPDNQMVRIPNSTIINSNLTNYSFNKTRRLTFEVNISYDTDMEIALETIKKAPDLCPTLLKNPAPAFWYNRFADSGISLVAAVWFNGSDLIQAKNEMFMALKKVFDDAKIEIPYDRIVVEIAK